MQLFAFNADVKVRVTGGNISGPLEGHKFRRDLDERVAVTVDPKLKFGHGGVPNLIGRGLHERDS